MPLQLSREDQLEEQLDPLPSLLGFKRLYCNHCGLPTGYTTIESDGLSYCPVAICLLSGETGMDFLPLTPEQEKAVMDTYDGNYGSTMQVKYLPVPGSEKVQVRVPCGNNFVSLKKKEETPKKKTRKRRNKKKKNNGPANPDADGAGQAASQPEG